MLNNTFSYKGKYYLPGTKIKLSKEYMQCDTFNNQNLWPYARFYKKVCKNNVVYYMFCLTNPDLYGEYHKYAGYFLVHCMYLDYAIEEITNPILFDYEGYCNYLNNKNDVAKKTINNEKIIGYIVLISVLIGSLIFKEFYIIWIIAFFIFYKWSEVN